MSKCLIDGYCECNDSCEIYECDALKMYQQGRADERERICNIIKDELESGYLMEKLLREIHSND